MIYSIENGNTSAKIEDLGAQLVSFKIDQKEYIRKRDEVWKSCSPLLFPIVGLLKDNYTLIDGKRYEMTSHGFIRNRVLKVYEKSLDSITFVDTFDDFTLSKWPFKYKFFVTYTLFEDKISVSMKVMNVDERDMYFNIGGHPGVVCPLENGEEFSDYSLVFDKEETFDSPKIVGNCVDFDHPEFKFEKVNNIKLDYKYFMIDAIVIRDILSSEVRLLNKSNKGYIFKWNGFNTVAFWAKPNQKFLCFEPWKGYADLYDTNNEFMTKPDLVKLAPNETKEFKYSVEVL